MRQYSFSRKSIEFTTGILFLIWVLAFYDRTVLILLVPGIKASFLVNDTQIGLLYGFAFSIFYALTGLVIGRVTDCANRRNLLIFAVFGWSVATIGCGLANSFAELFVARIAVGACQAVLAPASLSMVADFCAPERRGRVTGVLTSGAAVGGALSTMIGGVVLEYFAAHHTWHPALTTSLAPWRSTFIISGLPGLPLCVLMLMVSEPARHKHAQGIKIGKYLVTNRDTFFPLYAALALSLVTSYGLGAWYPIVLMRNLGMAPAEAGLFAGVGYLMAAVIAAVAGGYLSDKCERRDAGGGRLKLARNMMALTAVVILPLLLIDHRLAVLASFLAFAVLATATSSVAYTVLPELAPNEGRGQVIAVFIFIGYLFGLGLAPAAIALVSDHVLHSEAEVNLAMVIVCGPSSLLAALMATIGLPRVRRLRRQLIAEATAS